MYQSAVDLSIVDSKDDPAVVFIIANDCKVKVLKTKVNNICYVMKVLGDVCHLEFDTTGCEKAQK